MKVADLFADLHLNDKTFFAELDAALAEASKRSVKIKVDVDTTAARQKINTLVRDRQAKIKVDVDTAAARLEIDALKAKIDSLSSSARIGANGGGGSGYGSGRAGLIGALIGLSPAVAPLLATTTAGIVGLTGALTFAGVGIGAFAAIAKTQFGQVSEALKAYNKAQAAADSSLTGAQRTKALNDQAQAFAGLSSGQVGVAKGVQRLSADWKELNKQLERPVLVDFNGALTIARHGLDYIAPLALNAAGALKEVENRVDTALGSPFWRSFGQLVSRETGPATKSLATDLGNLAHGFASLLTAFLPVTHQVEAGLEHMTGSFAGLGQSRGLRDFVSYVQAEGPVVVHTLGDIASAFGVILHDALPVGAVLLDLVDDVARLVTAADEVNPVIVTMALGLLSVAKLAPLLASAGKSIGGLGSSLAKANPYALAAGVAVAGVAGYMTVLHNETQKAQEQVDKIGNSFDAFNADKAEKSIQGLTVQLESAKTTLANFRFDPNSFLGKVSEIGQDINPFADNTISSAKARAKATADELKQEQLQIASVSDNMLSLEYRTGKSREQIEKLAKATGLSLDTFRTNANDFADQNAVVEAFREIDKAAGVSQGTITNMSHASIAQMQALSKEVEDVAKKTADAFASSTDLTAVTFAKGTKKNPVDDTTTQLRKQYEATLTQAKAFVADTNAAITRGLDPTLVEHLLEAGPAKATPILQAMLRDHSGNTIRLANDTEKALEKISSQAVEYARVTALAVASPTDKLSRELPGIAKVLQAKAALGSGANVVTIATKLDTTPAHIAELARDFGVTLKGATAFVNAQGVKVKIKYDYPPGFTGPIPPGHAVQKVKVAYDYPPGFIGPIAEGHQVQKVSVVYDFPNGPLTSSSVYRSQVPGSAVQGPGILGHATGGKVRGPGTATSDSILARLSNGEGIVNARSMANLERAGLSIEKLNSYATGGIAGLPPLLAQAITKAQLGALPTGSYVSTPVYNAALSGAEGSLKAFIAASVLFIQRDLPAALTQGAAGIAGAGQQMIDQLAGLRDQYVALTAANVKAQADLDAARKKDAGAGKKDKSQADSDLKTAIKTAAEAKKALAQLGDAGPAVKSTTAFRGAEAQIRSYTNQLQKAANQNQVLSDKIEVAKTDLQTAKDAFKAYRDQVADSVKALGDFTTAQATVIDQKAVDSLTSSVSDLTQSLNDAQSAYDAALGTSQTTQLESLATAQDVYNATVAKYGKESANAVAAQRDLTDAQGRATAAAAKLTAAQAALKSGQDLLTSAQSGRAVNAGDIVANLSAQVGAAQAFATNIKKLQAAGLGQTAIKQILNAGPTAGAAFAAALANDLSQIGQVNALQGQLDTIGNDLGLTAAGWFNQSGVDAAQGILDGLKSKQSELQDAMSTLGKELAQAFKDALGIHSPSRVMHDLAVQVPAGVVSGIEAGRDRAVRASRGLAGAVAGGYSGVSGPMTSAPGSVAASGGRGGVNIEHLEVHDATDVGLMLQRLDFWTAHNGRA